MQPALMLSRSESTTAQASELGGQTVAISSGADTRIVGSNVLGDQGLDINAGGNLSIEAAQNTQSGSDFNETKKSGLFSSGGIGFTIGKQQQSTDAQNQQTTAAASTVGAIDGNVNLNAGQTYTQRGSDVVAPGGDINISAQTVTIEEARETASSQSEQRFKQSGVTVAVTSPVLSAVQTAVQQIEAAGGTRSDRMKALALANAALSLKQAGDAIAAGQAKEGGNAADQAGGIGISISLGSSRSQSNQSNSSDSARGSSVTAGGDINITASGAGANSDITIQGSEVKAGGTARLSAEDEVKLLAAANTAQEQSASSNKSGSIGVGIQLGAGGAQMGVTVSASAGKGQGSGSGTSYTNTQVSGQSVQIESGGDTTLKGAVVQGEQVTANVGGHLTIESLQDSSQYREKSQQIGGSVTFGPAPGGSLNAGQTKINSNYQSVGEPTAIRAGDGGFQVNVAGNTTLVGGQITSTQAAIDNNRNRYESQGGTTTSDLNNSASFEASSVSVGVGAGTPKPGASLSAGLSGVGIGSDSGSASSSTTAAISGIAGNTAARTGDAETGIKPIFNKDEVKREVNAQVAITSEFGKQASKLVGDHADTKLAEANRKEREAEQAKANGDTAKAEQLQAEADAIKDNWDDSGKLRVAAHTAIGGLTGGVGGAVGAASGTLTAPLVADALRQAGVDETLASGLTALASTVVGAATGGGAGAAAAFNEVTNNYLSHAERKALKLAETDCYTRGDPSACGTAGALRNKDLLSDKLLSNAVATCQGAECNEVSNFIRQQLAQQGCTAPSACPDYNTLASYWKAAQEKAQGIEAIYPEAWLLDAKAVVDLGKWGIRAVGASGKGSLDALSQLSKADSTKIANNFYREGPQFESNIVGGIPKANLRLEYEQASRDLFTQAQRMQAAGMSEEQVARWAVDRRNQLKIEYRELTPPEMLSNVEARNIRLYGNPMGPSVDQLLAKGKTWQEIIQGAAKPRGQDLDFSPPGFNGAGK